MQKSLLYGLLLIVFILFFTKNVKCQVITDTIFFNERWQICEKPIAVYYRIGTLTIDSTWYYTGKFKDYNINNILMTEGEYSKNGFRNGHFNFYDTEGNLLVSGNYERDRPYGTWEWKFTNGSTRAIINFPVDETDFQFVYYRSSDGKVLLENGTGEFTWSVNAFEDTYRNYIAEGSFKHGIRTGTWKYYEQEKNGDKLLLCKEMYDDNGELKKAKTTYITGSQTLNRKCVEYNFVPQSLKQVENISYDNFFTRGPDSSSATNLLNYLLNRKSVDIIIKNKNFEKALSYILGNLERYRDKLDYTTKDIDGRIDFKIGDKALPEDITVEGANITSEEKNFLLYLMSKFKNIEMPGDSLMAIEGYHTIYFYSVDIRSCLPYSVRLYAPEKEFFFSTIPKDKYLVWLKANQKQIKKYIRKEFLHYW